MMNKSLNSNDFLLMASNISSYTDLMITRSVNAQLPVDASSENSFGSMLKRIFHSK